METVVFWVAKLWCLRTFQDLGTTLLNISFQSPEVKMAMETARPNLLHRVQDVIQKVVTLPFCHY